MVIATAHLSSSWNAVPNHCQVLSFLQFCICILFVYHKNLSSNSHVINMLYILKYMWDPTVYGISRVIIKSQSSGLCTTIQKFMPTNVVFTLQQTFFSQITNQGEFSQGTHFPPALIALAITTGVWSHVLRVTFSLIQFCSCHWHCQQLWLS